MSKLVVDASVAAKWLVTEALSDKAIALLGRSDDLISPDLLLPEVGNILWKKARSGDLTPAMASERFRALQSMGLTLVPSAATADRALAIALETQRTVYDALYLALAEAEGCRFVTADERLVNALSQTPIAKLAVWLGAI
jgi:predicted nucleic acid-binding protein